MCEGQAFVGFCAQERWLMLLWIFVNEWITHDSIQFELVEYIETVKNQSFMTRRQEEKLLEPKLQSIVRVVQYGTCWNTLHLTSPVPMHDCKTRYSNGVWMRQPFYFTGDIHDQEQHIVLLPIDCIIHSYIETTILYCRLFWCLRCYCTTKASTTHKDKIR